MGHRRPGGQPDDAGEAVTSVLGRQLRRGGLFPGRGQVPGVGPDPCRPGEEAGSDRAGRRARLQALLDGRRRFRHPALADEDLGEIQPGSGLGPAGQKRAAHGLGLGKPPGAPQGLGRFGQQVIPFARAGGQLRRPGQDIGRQPGGPGRQSVGEGTQGRHRVGTLPGGAAQEVLGSVPLRTAVQQKGVAIEAPHYPLSLPTGERLCAVCRTPLGKEGVFCPTCGVRL